MWTICLPGERGGGHRGLRPKLRQYSCRRWPFRHRAWSGSPRCAAHSGAYLYGEHGATGGGRDPCDADGVDYAGESRIDGVPGSASPILLHFLDVAGSSCGALLPTGRVRDRFDGVEVTCIDNGMPVILLRACDLGCTGYETREQLDNDDALKRRLESIRLQAGPLMQLGDVSQRTVPKMTLIAEPRHGGAISSRTFIPHRCHASIGVFGAVSVASACLLPGSVAQGWRR